jgi:hypothetical protein
LLQGEFGDAVDAGEEPDQETLRRRLAELPDGRRGDDA